MANMDKSDIEKILKKNGLPSKGDWDKFSSFEALETKLSEFNKNDIAQTYHVQDDGNISLGYAAAVFRYMECVGAIGVAVLCTPKEYEQFKETEELIRHNIIKARTEINRRLKYS